MTNHADIVRLPDETLLTELARAAMDERRATARVIALLAEVDTRRLYLAQGCSSLFVYCTQVLYLSEHAAYGRIEAARAARRCPEILTRLADGSLTLTAVCLLAPHLTPDNQQELLGAARHKSKREVEHLVAALRPQPAVASTVRKLPRPGPVRDRAVLLEAHGTHERSAAPMEAALDSSAQTAGRDALRPPSRSAVVAPLAPERYKVQFTASKETYEKLRAAQDLLRHAVPDGDIAAIFDRALTLLLSDLARKKLAATSRPRPMPKLRTRSRHIPAQVRRAVWTRDGGRCAFVALNGRRCGERGFLEFHHLVPYADGGETTTANVELRCRQHNAYEAERWFGSPPVVRECAVEYDATNSVWPELSERVNASPDRGGG